MTEFVTRKVSIIRHKLKSGRQT